MHHAENGLHTHAITSTGGTTPMADMRFSVGDLPERTRGCRRRYARKPGRNSDERHEERSVLAVTFELKEGTVVRTIVPEPNT